MEWNEDVCSDVSDGGADKYELCLSLPANILISRFHRASHEVGVLWAVHQVWKLQR